MCKQCVILKTVCYAKYLTTNCCYIHDALQAIYRNKCLGLQCVSHGRKGKAPFRKIYVLKILIVKVLVR